MKTLTAKFNGRCQACHGAISKGERINWSKADGSKHVTCPPLALAPPQRTEKRNKKGDSCRWCGTWVSPGEGNLLFCLEDSGCLEHHDRSGYHVECADKAGCASRVKERAEKREAKKKLDEERAKVSAFLTPIADAIRACAEAQFTMGLVPVHVFVDRTPLKYVARYGNVSWYETRVKGDTPQGDFAVVRRVSSYDFHREDTYVPRPLAKELVKTWAAANKLTVEACRDWLAKYAGCYGHEMYELAIEVMEEAP